MVGITLYFIILILLICRRGHDTKDAPKLNYEKKVIHSPPPQKKIHEKTMLQHIARRALILMQIHSKSFKTKHSITTHFLDTTKLNILPRIF